MYALSSSVWHVLNERTTKALRDGGHVLASLALGAFGTGAANRAGFGLFGIDVARTIGVDAAGAKGGATVAVAA